MTPALYVHIPFCRAKCAYCDFFSVKTPHGIEDKYIDCVINEASCYAKRYGVLSWRTVYIGGGTPSLLSAAQISSLLQGLLKASGGGAPPGKPLEVTFEANPESLTEEKLNCLAECGVDRLSVGVQSLCGAALRSVSRITTAEDNINALDLIHRLFRGRVSVDVMAGLPYLGGKDFSEGLRRILSYNPGHVSLYTLTLEEGTPLFEAVKTGKVAFNPDTADSQWLSGRDILLGSGYRQYEVSSFCLEGEESLHNSSYWAQGDYIGVGAGAVGTIYGTESLRWTNTRDIALYESFWDRRRGTSFGDEDLERVRECETIPLEEREEEALMTALRTSRGINSAVYSKLFSPLKPWHGDIERRLSAIDSGDLVITHNPDGTRNYSLTAGALLFLNRILLRL